MSRSIKIICLFLLPALLIVAPEVAMGQSNNHSIFEHLIDTTDLKRHIDTLCSPALSGRGAGSEGGNLARKYIESVLKEYGIEKRGLEYTQEFKAGNSTLANVVGEIHSTNQSPDYIILGAHYDHLGTINGSIYPGADDNASGVATLLEIAQTLSRLKRDGGGIPVNVIIIFFDGKEMDMAGSKYFMSKFRIKNDFVKYMLNIDQIGSNFAPPGKNKEYLLLLGEVTEFEKQTLDICNQLSELRLDIDYTFYGSEKFYEIFYKLSDHYQFAKAGMRAYHFTSGITGKTYKTTDTPETIDYMLLEKRGRLIYRFIYNLL